MTRYRFLIAAAVTSVCVLAGQAYGQATGAQATIQSTAYDFNYYSQPQAAPSPSDVPVAPAPSSSVSGCSYNSGGGCGCYDACSSCCDCCCYLFGPCDAWTLTGDNCYNITVGGWMSFGYYDNNVPLSTTPGDGLSFRDYPDHLTADQMWLYVEKSIAGDCCWDWGGRFDLMYGVDAQKTQAFGNQNNVWDVSLDHGVYGWAMPQAYLEVGRGNLSIIAGHFYTLVGYEVVPAPGNFFYTHALTMFNSEPFTHTGILATYEYNDAWTFYGGWTLGWDTGFDQFDDGNNFIGGFSYNHCDLFALTYIMCYGDFGAISTPGAAPEDYSHSVVFDLNITDRLNYVFQTDYKKIIDSDDEDVGINQYLIWSYNDCWGFGGRIEWWRDGDGGPAGEPMSYNEFALALNWRPHANIVVRPEVRYDWTPATGFDQTTLGGDVIFTF